MAKQKNPVVNAVDHGYVELPHLELANYMMTTGARIKAHRDLGGEFPVPVANGEKLEACGSHYSSLAVAALTDPQQLTACEAFRPTAITTVASTVSWVCIRSVNENNPSMLATVTYEPAHKPKRNTTPIPLFAPGMVHIKQSSISGEVDIDFPKVKGAITYFAQFCQQNPGLEESWNQEVHLSKCRGKISGLERGKVYYFRVRAFGHAGYGPWSAIVSLMVI